jgi:hypothetical protein
MTPAAKLERQVRRVGWVGVLLTVAGALLYSTERVLDSAAKHMAELEIAKEQQEEANRRLSQGLDGALAYIHEQAGSPLDEALDTQGSPGHEAFDSQGSTQPDQS